jgi:hypothetical protein
MYSSVGALVGAKALRPLGTATVFCLDSDDNNMNNALAYDRLNVDDSLDRMINHT